MEEVLYTDVGRLVVGLGEVLEHLGPVVHVDPDSRNTVLEFYSLRVSRSGRTT